MPHSLIYRGASNTDAFPERAPLTAAVGFWTIQTLRHGGAVLAGRFNLTPLLLLIWQVNKGMQMKELNANEVELVGGALDPTTGGLALIGLAFVGPVGFVAGFALGAGIALLFVEV